MEKATIDCQHGGHCIDTLTCTVDTCDEERRGGIACMLKHQRHQCAHDFASGPWVEIENGGSTSCKCGLTCMDHDMRYAP